MRAARTRRVLLAIDAMFGLLLIGVAIVGWPGVAIDASPTPPPLPEATAEVATRFGALWPPGQTAGLALADDGSLGIVDRGRQVVTRLDASGRPVAEWGPRFGAGLDAVDLMGIAFDGDGWYVLDCGALRIIRLDLEGRVQPERTIELGPLATYGPTGLASDNLGALYLADTGRDRILVFESDGRQSRSIGQPGGGPGQLKQPMGVAFASDGSMFVADWENSRVQRFAADGRAERAWQLPANAWDVAVDVAGRVYVPDGNRRLVRMFSADGQPLAEIGGLPIDFPSQVAVHEDTLWVLGRDALVRVDLTPYAALQGSPSASSGVRWPLAAVGAVLLFLAAAGAVWERRHRRVGSAAHPAPTAPAAPRPAPAINAAPVVGALSPSGVALLLIGGLGAAFATLRLTDPLVVADPWWRLGLLAASSVLFAVGCNLTARGRPLVWIAANWPKYTECDPSPQPSPLRGEREEAHSLSPRGERARVRGALLAASVLAVAAAVVWWLFRFSTPEATRGALLWLLACVLLIVALRPRFTRLTIASGVPIVLFLLALAPRIWNNAEIPYGIWFDEAQAGIEARRFLQEGRFTPITDTYGRDASGFYYLLAAVMALGTDPVLASRGLAAVLGALNIPLLYVLGRELFGWRVGLAAALLLATSRWHLDVSRLGWGPITLPLCATLGFWLLARAVRTSRASDAAWAGVALGIGMHGYIGFRILPLVALALLIYGAYRQGWGVSVALRRVAVLMGVMALFALPILIVAVLDPSGFNGRLNQTVILAQPIPSSQKLDEIWSNVQKHALMFHVSGDLNGRHNIPGWPMLDPLSGVLLCLGLGWLVLRPLDWRTVLAAGWGVAALSGGVLTLAFEAPQAMRTLGVTPLLALLGGLGLVLVLDRLVALAPRVPRLRTVAQAAGALVVAGIGIWTVSTFFTRQMTDPLVWESFSTRETVPAREAAQRGGRVEAILGSATIAPSVESGLLAPQWRDKIRPFDITTDLPYRQRGPALIFLETEHDAALAEEVARYYPNAPRRPIGAPNGHRTLVEELLLEPEVLAAQRGFTAEYVGADDSRVERREAAAELGAFAAPVALPARARWRIGLIVDTPGGYAFRATDGFRMTLDDLALPEDGRRVDLARGNHILTVDGTLGAEGAMGVRWQVPGATEWRTLDRGALYVAPEGGNGLEASFFPNTNWEGEAREKVIDPVVDRYFHLSPFRRLNIGTPDGWSAEWRGFVDVPSTGTYGLEVERISRAGLWIDDRLVFDDAAPDAPENTHGTLDLSAGRHAIRVRLQNRAAGGPRLYLMWTPPGGQREVVPGRALYPPPPPLEPQAAS